MTQFDPYDEESLKKLKTIVRMNRNLDADMKQRLLKAFDSIDRALNAGDDERAHKVIKSILSKLQSAQNPPQKKQVTPVKSPSKKPYTYTNVDSETDKQFFKDRLNTMKMQFYEISQMTPTVRRALDEDQFSLFRQEFTDAYKSWLNLVDTADEIGLKSFGEKSRVLNDKVRNVLRKKVEFIRRGKLNEWKTASGGTYGEATDKNYREVQSDFIERNELQEILSSDNFDESLGLSLQDIDSDQSQMGGFLESLKRKTINKTIV